MAVIAILASAIAPSVFDDIKRARRDKESQQVSVLRDHLEQFILTNKQIPQRTTASWTAAIASVATLPQSKVEFNERGFRRGYYVDPRFFSASDTAFPGYTQQAGLSSRPVSPRIMLVSILSDNAPSAPTTSAAFSALWAQTPSATLTEGPDIKIERLNLSSAFQRLIFSNENTAQTAYQLETGTTNAIPAASGSTDGVITRYVLRNTRVGLYANPFPGGSLDQVFMAADDKDYAFQLSGSLWAWRRP